MEMEHYIGTQLSRLAEFTATKGKGVSRLPFTKEALACAAYLEQEMQAIGLQTHIDGSGGVFGRLEGECSNTILCGSHYDSVMYGGMYDGIAGVVCGMAAVKYLVEHNIKPAYSIEIVAMNDEEGARFSGGYHTSKAILGEGDIHSMYTTTDKDGITVVEAMEEAGYSIKAYREAKRNLDAIRCFLEVHIEQGPILENNHKQIGIVRNIVGIRRFLVDIFGRTDHAGTTPMNMRIDAMEVAAHVIAEIGCIARRYPESVATVGFITAAPNEINTIAHHVQFSLDIRSAKEEVIEAILSDIMENTHRICRTFRTTNHFEPTLHVLPSKMDSYLDALIEQACVQRSLSYQEIDSGAGHDALPIAKKLDTAMIFVPSAAGRSHCKEEYTKTSDLLHASEILMDLFQTIE